MFCRNCGNELHENDKFCSKCGAKVEPKEELEVNKGDSVLSDKVISSPFSNSETQQEKPSMNWDEEEPKRADKSGLEMVWEKEEPVTHHRNINKEMNWDEEPVRKTGDVNFVWDTEEIPKADNRSTDSIKFDWSSVVDDKERRATKKIPAWRMATRTNPEETVKEEPKTIIETKKEDPIVFEPEIKAEETPIYKQEEVKPFIEPKTFEEPEVIETTPPVYEPIVPVEEEIIEKEPETEKPDVSIYEQFLIKETEIEKEEEEPESTLNEMFLPKEETLDETETEEVLETPVLEPVIDEVEVNEPDILDKPEYISPFDEDDEMDPELIALEKELFASMEDDYVDERATIKVDKFYTLDKKSEEFQSLLDKEYEKIKKSGVNYDLMDETDEEIYTEEDEYIPGSLDPGELYGSEGPLYKEEPKEDVIAKEVQAELKKEKKEEEEYEPEPEKKKSHGALKFLVAILIILVLLELFILAMNNFAPDSAITQTLNDGIRSITDLISENKDMNILDNFMA